MSNLTLTPEEVALLLDALADMTEIEGRRLADMALDDALPAVRIRARDLEALANKISQQYWSGA